MVSGFGHSLGLGVNIQWELKRIPQPSTLSHLKPFNSATTLPSDRLNVSPQPHWASSAAKSRHPEALATDWDIQDPVWFLSAQRPLAGMDGICSPLSSFQEWQAGIRQPGDTFLHAWPLLGDLTLKAEFKLMFLSLLVL